MSHFDDFVHMLVDECERDGRFIYFWSQHEDVLIKDLVSPELYARFDKYSANALKLARRFKNQRDLEIEEKAPKLLNTYLGTCTELQHSCDSKDWGRRELPSN